MLRFLKWSVIALAVSLLLLQFARPARTNSPVDESRGVEAQLHVTPEVKAIFARACNDCHSNRTEWPWYSHVAPVSWYVSDHVAHGRRHMDLSDWAKSDRQRADYLLGDICKTTKHGSMPLASYTLVHRAAVLSARDVGTLCAWTQAERQRLATAATK